MQKKLFTVLDGKVQQLLTGIQSTDECQQLQAVMELCQVC